MKSTLIHTDSIVEKLKCIKPANHSDIEVVRNINLNKIKWLFYVQFHSQRTEIQHLIAFAQNGLMLVNYCSQDKYLSNLI